MTIDEFIERLSKTSKSCWNVDHTRIRREHYGTRHCPISAVSGDPDDLPYPVAAGTKLGLSRSDAMAIVDAADGISGYNSTLRSRLLEACGL